VTLAQPPQIAMSRYPSGLRAPSTSSSSPRISRPVQGHDPAAGVRHPRDDHGHGNVALNAIKTYLDPGESAVGTAVNVRHLAPTPVGRLVTGEAEVTKVDGWQIEFAVRATEGAKEIGAGSHSRVVIDVAKFTRRLG
jgi:hypothetical protein